MPAVLSPACTIILCRQTPDGLSVFMVQRHRKSGFFPSAWVFPGGRVEDADALATHPLVSGGQQVCEQMAVPLEKGVATLVAGVRETYEEAGIWLGEGTLPAAERDRLNAGTATLADVLDDSGQKLDLNRLGLWCWWNTPEAEPRRYDTRFLVAVVTENTGEHDNHETVDSAWVSPAEIVGQRDNTAFPMAPPTWWVLCELAAFESADAVLAACADRSPRAITPVLEMTDGFHLYLPGHSKHPESGIAGQPCKIGFADDRWIAFDDPTA